jgi:hypothetical protein
VGWLALLPFEIGAQIGDVAPQPTPGQLPVAHQCLLGDLRHAGFGHTQAADEVGDSPQ